jgi:hypothetical protein
MLNGLSLNAGLLSAGTPLGWVAPDFESAIVAAVKACEPIAEIAGDKVYPIEIPEEEQLPAVAYRVMAKGRERMLSGPNGIAVARVFVGCESENYDDTKLVVDAARQLFTPFREKSNPPQVPFYLYGWWVIETILSNEFDTYDQTADGSDRGVYGSAVEFLFRYRES